MAKRRTMGENPLDAVIPTKTATAPRGGGRKAAATATKAPPKKQAKVIKERLTVHLPVPLIDRVKNAVYWTPGLTLASLAEKSLESTVDAIEKKNGEPFPQRKEDLKGGRPIK
jgi:hypothetical protein